MKIERLEELIREELQEVGATFDVNNVMELIQTQLKSVTNILQ